MAKIEEVWVVEDENGEPSLTFRSQADAEDYARLRGLKTYQREVLIVASKTGEASVLLDVPVLELRY